MMKIFLYAFFIFIAAPSEEKGDHSEKVNNFIEVYKKKTQKQIDLEKAQLKSAIKIFAPDSSSFFLQRLKQITAFEAYQKAINSYTYEDETKKLWRVLSEALKDYIAGPVTLTVKEDGKGLPLYSFSCKTPPIKRTSGSLKNLLSSIVFKKGALLTVEIVSPINSKHLEKAAKLLKVEDIKASKINSKSSALINHFISSGLNEKPDPEMNKIIEKVILNDLTARDHFTQKIKRDAILQVLKKTESQKLKGIFGTPKSIAFSPDNQKLIIVGKDKILYLFDTKTGKVIYSNKELKALTTSIEFSPDGTEYVMGFKDGSIKVWNSENGQLKVHIKNTSEADIERFLIKLEKPDKTNLIKFLRQSNHVGEVSRVSFTPQGDRIISLGNGYIKLWNAANGKLIKTIAPENEPQGTQFGFNSPIAVNASFDKVATGGADSSDTIKIWDFETGKMIRPLKHEKGFNAVNLFFLPGGKELLVVGLYELTIWNIESAKLVKSIPTNDKRLIRGTISNNGRVLLLQRFSSAYRLLEPEHNIDRLLYQSSPPRPALLNEVDNYAVISPDGNLMAIQYSEGTLIKTTAFNHYSLINSTAQNSVFSLDYKHFRQEKNVNETDFFTVKGKLCGTARRPVNEFHLFQYAADQKWLASLQKNSDKIQIWGSDHKLKSQLAHKNPVTAFALSTDSSQIVSASKNSNINVWNPVSGSLIKSINGKHLKEICSVAFSENLKYIYSVSKDKQLKIWLAVSGENVYAVSIADLNYSPGTLSSGTLSSESGK